MEESLYLLQDNQGLKQEVLAHWFELACERKACEMIAFEVQNQLLFDKTRFIRNRQTIVSHGTTRCVRGRNALHFVSLEKVSYQLSGILPTTEFLNGWGASALCQIAACRWIEQGQFVMEQNHEEQQQEALALCLAVRIEFTF
jgi:hypothetical protein